MKTNNCEFAYVFRFMHCLILIIVNLHIRIKRRIYMESHAYYLRVFGYGTYQSVASAVFSERYEQKRRRQKILASAVFLAASLLQRFYRAYVEVVVK